jgi:hypothetical protein
MTSKPKILTRDDILAKRAPRTELEPTPEWGGGSVIVKAMTGAERGEFEMSSMRIIPGAPGEAPTTQIVHPELARVRLVSMTAVDESGARLFTEADLVALGELDAAPLDRIADRARRLSGLTKKDMEALTTGLKADPNGSSGSD